MQAIGRDMTVEEAGEMIQKVKAKQYAEKSVLPQDQKKGEVFLSEEEFIKLIGDEYARSSKTEELEDAYQEFDPDERGITKENLRNVMEEHGEKVGDDELDKIFKEADHDNDGRLNFDDFVRAFMSRS